MLAQKRLNGGRIHHAMRWVGQCEAAFDMMCERAISRDTKGELLDREQMIQEMIVESSADIRALRLMALHSAWCGNERRVEGTGRDRRLKFWGARVLHDVVDRAIQVHGALGWSTDLPLVGMYVMARQFRIADGADEVHKAFVATRKAKAYKPVDGWPSRHVPSRKAELRGALRRVPRQRSRELLMEMQWRCGRMAGTPQRNRPI